MGPAVRIFSLILIIKILSPADLFADSPLKPRLLQPEAYSETYTAVLELEEDIHIQIQFAVTNIGIGDQHSMCRVLFSDRDGAWNESPVFGRDQWWFEPPAKLAIGPCSIEAEQGRTTIVAEVARGRFEAVLSGSIERTSPPCHLIEADDGFFDNEILLPWAEAEVRLGMMDQPKRLLRGHGCLYHFWVTAWPAGLARRWVRLYGLSAEGSLLLVSHFPPGEEPAQGSLWSPGAPCPIPIDSLVMDDVNEAGHGFSITAGEHSYRLHMTQLLYRHAPLEEVGLLGRIISFFMGNWVTRTYRAELRIEEGGVPPLPVIVEITEEE